jgi:hypothetical protein
MIIANGLNMSIFISFTRIIQHIVRVIAHPYFVAQISREKRAKAAAALIK